jgi:hypothetical protein
MYRFVILRMDKVGGKYGFLRSNSNETYLKALYTYQLWTILYFGIGG